MILAAILTLFFIISWVGYSKYQFLERDSSDAAIKISANKSWHKFKFLNQVVFFVAAALLSSIEFGIALALTYQLVFDSAINVIVEKQPIYHLGTDTIDATLKKVFREKGAYVFLCVIVILAYVVCFVWPNALDFIKI